jgi:hypothetical protein
MLRKKVFFALVYSAHTSTSYYVNGKALGVFTRVRPIVEFLDFQQIAKGQLISKQNCRAVTSPKKRT